MRRGAGALSLLLLTLPSCRTRLLELPGPELPDGGFVDLVASDLAPPVCRTHQILSVPLTDITPLDGTDLPIGGAVRLRIGFALRDSCDVAGDVSVRVMPGNATDFAVITMRAWRGSNDCGPPAIAHRAVALGADGSLTNLRLLVADGAPGGTQTLTVTFRKAAPPCPGCTLTPCSEDVDCQAGICDSLKAECIGCGGDPTCGCPAHEACGFGRTCTMQRCVPVQTLPPATCQCDGDCGAGRLCAQDGTCVIPCTTQFPFDCPPGAPQCAGGRCVR